MQNVNVSNWWVRTSCVSRPRAPLYGNLALRKLMGEQSDSERFGSQDSSSRYSGDVAD